LFSSPLFSGSAYVYKPGSQRAILGMCDPTKRQFQPEGEPIF